MAENEDFSVFFRKLCQNSPISAASGRRHVLTFRRLGRDALYGEIAGIGETAESMSGSMFRWRTKVQWTGLICGPILALVGYLLLPQTYVAANAVQAPFTVAGRVTLSLMIWMAVWWVTEAVDISVTALLPLFLFPLLGVQSIEDTAAPYAHPMIFLFMGGFLIAIAMQRWDLDRAHRVADVACRGNSTGEHGGRVHADDSWTERVCVEYGNNGHDGADCLECCARRAQ